MTIYKTITRIIDTPPLFFDFKTLFFNLKSVSRETASPLNPISNLFGSDQAAQAIREFKKQAKPYDNLPLNSKLLEESLALQNFEGQSVLDIGTGTGNAAVFLAKKAGSVTGIDVSPHMLEVAKAKALDKKAEIAFEQQNYNSLSFVPGTFDAAVSRYALSYAEDPVHVFKELYRVIKPGATVTIVEVVNTETSEEVTSTFNGIEKVRNYAHLKFLTPKQIVQGLEAAGFSIPDSKTKLGSGVALSLDASENAEEYFNSSGNTHNSAYLMQMVRENAEFSADRSFTTGFRPTIRDGVISLNFSIAVVVAKKGF